jgi:hypothetical protein
LTGYRLAGVILTDPSEAEDAVHDAFVTAWANWTSLRDHALFERWLLSLGGDFRWYEEAGGSKGRNLRTIGPSRGGQSPKGPNVTGLDREPDP